MRKLAEKLAYRDFLAEGQAWVEGHRRRPDLYAAARREAMS